MTARSREEIDQRLIDHEVRVSETRETGQRYAASAELWQGRQTGQADRRWYRDELIAMLTAARSEADLQGLGLSDDVVREARLGDTLLEAWTRFRPPHLPPPPHARGLYGGASPSSPRRP